MVRLEQIECARPDLLEIARTVAHRHTTKCTGGQIQGSDGMRWHSKKCDALTADIYVALHVKQDQR